MDPQSATIASSTDPTATRPRVLLSRVNTPSLLLLVFCCNNQRLREEANELRSQIAETEYGFAYGLETVIELLDEASDADEEDGFSTNENFDVETAGYTAGGQHDKGGDLAEFTPTLDYLTEAESSVTGTAKKYSDLFLWSCHRLMTII